MNLTKEKPPGGGLPQATDRCLRECSRLALPPKGYVTDTGKSQDYHRPGGGFGDGSDSRHRACEGPVACEGHLSHKRRRIIGIETQAFVDTQDLKLAHTARADTEQAICEDTCSQDVAASIPAI